MSPPAPTWYRFAPGRKVHDAFPSVVRRQAIAAVWAWREALAAGRVVTPAATYVRADALTITEQEQLTDALR